MKNLILEFLLIFLSFQLISSNPVNYEIVEIPPGVSFFSYELTTLLSSTDTISTAMILMKFLGDTKITININKQEIGNIEAKDINYLIGLPVIYLNMLGFNSFEFIFDNNNTESIKMIFIDYSKEINISLEQFLNWDHDLRYFTLEDTEYTPKPIIFDIDTIPENIICNFNITFNGSILNDNNLLYYCINDENGCNYKALNDITFLKGKRYKIKLNPCYINDITSYTLYFFPPIQPTKVEPEKLDIQEIQFGFTLYETQQNIKKYFLVNTKSYQKFYIYINGRNSYFNYAFITEEQKNNLEKEINNIHFEERYIYDEESFSANNMDYFLFIIENDYSDFQGGIFLVNKLYYIYENSAKVIENEYSLIRATNRDYNYENVFLSSANNMQLTSDLSFEPKQTNKLIINHQSNSLVFVDSLNQISTINFYSYKKPYNEYNFNLVTENEINDIFSKYGPDSIFMRTSSHTTNFGFNSTYVYGINEQYYLYTKKYFGNVNIYQYNKQLDKKTSLNEIIKPIPTYEVDDYKLINDEIIIVSGYQFFSYYNSYGSLYDVFMQKVNDLETINLNPNMFKFNNLVKLLNKDKQYILNFNVDHYIQLDNKTSDANVVFTDKDGKEYYLNKDNRIIKNLSGEKIKVKSDQNALLYFYKKIKDNSKIKIIELENNSQNLFLGFSYIYYDAEKSMPSSDKIKEGVSSTENARKLYVIKDFGFKECYPILSEKSWDVIEATSGILIIENLYDKLELELDEEEKYIIYIFDSFDENNLPTFNNENWEFKEPISVNNSITRGNKYNFEIIPASDSEFINIIFYSKNKPSFTYELIGCENQTIQFNYINSIGSIQGDYTLIDPINYINKDLNNEESIANLIASQNEVLFAYHFHNPEDNYGKYSQDEYKIISVNELNKNTLQVNFSPSLLNSLVQYHIIISKKSELNNIESFSNRCFIGNLMTHNSEEIFVKTVFEKSESSETVLSTIVDISSLSPSDNDEIIIDIISNNMNWNSLLAFYKPIEFRFGEKEILVLELNKEVNFDFRERNLFKFDYKEENIQAQLVFTFNSLLNFNLLITDGNNIEYIKFRDWKDNYININLPKSGTYYFQFMSLEPEEEDADSQEGSFVATLKKSELIKVIDLSESKYYNFDQKNDRVKSLPNFYKVEGLKENKNVLFYYQIIGSYGNYPENPFTICNVNTGECFDNIFIFKFIKGNDYIIYINYVGGESDYYDYYSYYYPKYIIMPITDNNLEIKEKGYYSYVDPKVIILNLENQEDMNTLSMSNKIVYSYTDDKITKDNIDSLTFEELDSSLIHISNPYKKKFIVIIPMGEIDNSLEKKIVFVNKVFSEEAGSYTIEAKKNALIFLNDGGLEDTENSKEYIPFYNVLRTYSSPNKNMKFFGVTNSSENINSNLIIENYLNLPIYIDQSDKNIDITVKKYTPKYTFFGAIDNNSFQNYLDFFYYYIKSNSEELSQLRSIFPIYVRLNSDLLPFSEYFNFYLSEKLKKKLKLYVKKIYGSSDLYECEADPLEKFDFDILTRPLSSCKNKKTLFNRLITFDKTKIFSGYLDSNSFFDIYIDLEGDESNDIKISSLYNENPIDATAKYLTKGVEYNLDLKGKYMAKLEEGFNAKVSIYDGNKNDILTLESGKRTGSLEGKNLKIKSNNDAMVYFYGQLNSEMKQVKIENKNGKNIFAKISFQTHYYVDFGFEGYSFLNPGYANIYGDDSMQEKNYSYFIENIYDKLNIKLAEGESFYIYYEKEGDIEIDYSFDNLKNPKNDYTFMVIPKTDSLKSNLVINKFEKDYIRYQVNYCKNPLKSIKMDYYKNNEDYSYDDFTIESFDFNNQITSLDVKLPNFSSDLKFKASDEFVFSYSFIDLIDEYLNNTQLKNDRKELNDLKISEINNLKGSTYSLKFKPNYKNSLTRYIIVIGQKDEKNTEENFNNPCYITKLVTEQADGIKIINIYDIGDKEYVDAELNLSDFSKSKMESIISIISQELRFDKKINYYESKTFQYIPESKKEDKGFATVYIIVISITGLIVLLIIIFLIIKYIKRRQDIDFSKKAEEIKQEKLLSEL